MAKLLDCARDILHIAVEMGEAFSDDIDFDEGDLYMFDQTWGSTALGFGGIGGQAMTTATTYVFVPKDLNRGYVYFGGRYAYDCPINNRFREDLRNHRMASVQESGRYIKEDK